MICALLILRFPICECVKHTARVKHFETPGMDIY